MERHLPWIQKQVRLRLGSKLRAKGETCDYVQDAVIQFLEYSPRFIVTGDEQFRALLYRVVENTLRKKHRWFAARRRAVSRERPLPATTILNLDRGRGSNKTPSQYAARHEQEAWIRLVMEFLKPEDQEVLVLRQWEGLSFQEIGEQLGLESNAARMGHARALHSLVKKAGELRRLELEKFLEQNPPWEEGHE